jgi:hypothetical protein
MLITEQHIKNGTIDFGIILPPNVRKENDRIIFGEEVTLSEEARKAKPSQGRHGGGGGGAGK